MKKFTKQEIRDLLNQVMIEEISFSEMVEVINERVSEAEKPCIEDIPVRKFKKGDKVRIKAGVSSKTHGNISPSFLQEMDGLIGKTMAVDRYTYGRNYVKCEGVAWVFLEDWLEPYVEELEKGDLAIFWDEKKELAVIRIYERFDVLYFQHRDHTKTGWENAIKFESKEQYERFIKGEI